MRRKKELLLDARRPRRRRFTLVIAVLAVLVIAGLLIPGRYLIPVEGATTSDWNRDTFWHEPWGASGVHKGVDIFADKGTNVLASTGGVVLYRGQIDRGGNVVVILGPKWRLHYYAHLDAIDDAAGRVVSSGTVIGTVGNSGNAAGKPSHLHYALVSLVPYPWRMDADTQGWKKMFYLDPTARLGGLKNLNQLRHGT